jgi:NADH-quinone oxidoreductase subunit H
VLAGWASNNRWALLGSVRGSAQMISYEIAMGLALVSAVLVYDTFDFQEMVRWQGHYLLNGWVPTWGILYQPLGFLLFFVGGVAESKRTPFDLPESESELIAGYFTEYSGGKHFMFFMSDFVEVVLVAALVTTLYFGGWQIPYLGPDGFHLPTGTFIAVPALLVTLLGIVAFSVKLLAFTILQIVVRWTLPRFRYDQLMHLGWKGLLPVGLANVVVTAGLILWFGGHA